MRHLYKTETGYFLIDDTMEQTAQAQLHRNHCNICNPILLPTGGLLTPVGFSS